LPELKSTSERWGHQAEDHVITLLARKKFQLITRNFKTPIAEIDLVFWGNQRLYLVEVKRLSSPWRSFERITQSQQKKLLLNQIYFSQQLPKIKTQALVAWVDAKNRISFVDLKS
jgi:Holliday junction resolvase-like predicted endonuclease